MNWTDYQNEALRTAGQKQQWDYTLPSPSSPQQAQLTRDSLAVAALGLAGEAGEAADLLKKVLFHNHPPSSNSIDRMEAARFVVVNRGRIDCQSTTITRLAKCAACFARPAIDTSATSNRWRNK